MRVETFTVTQRGIGKPDYSKEIASGRTLAGYRMAYGESHTWPYLGAIAGGAAEGIPGTRDPIPIGETVRLIDAFTGLDHIAADEGEDWLLKVVYFNFDQPMLWEIFQVIDGVPVHTCISTFPAMKTPETTQWTIGWARSFLEAISVAGICYAQVTNVGLGDATGKAWIVGFRKMGEYEWF